MSFEALKFTNSGKALQIRALSGEQLVFTQIQVGEGTLTPESIPSRTSLVSLIKSINITKSTRTNERYTIEGVFRNDEIPRSFYYKEIGIFAADPDHPNDRSKDILYAYQNAYDTAEYISISSGEIIEKIVRVNMFVGEAESVSALIDDSTVFVTRDEMSETLAGYATTTEMARKADANHTHAAATQSAAGMMSAVDKKKLDGIAEGANKITVDTALSATSVNPVQNKAVNAAMAGKADKTAIPTTLPANGGNADTVDGKHAADFYPAKTANIEGGDYDDLVNDGVYEVQGNAAASTKNAPDGNNSNNNYYVLVYKHSVNWITQVATSVRGDRKQYIRSKENGVWNAWQRISAGDADTLDGKHAADFLPTAGGTVTGSLYLKDSHYVHGIITDGTHGGFYDCAEITIKTAWANHSIVFTMSNRGSRPITVVLIFANVATADPEIASLIYYGGSIYNNRVVCYKTGTSTWRLAVHMLDKNDKWTVHDYYRGEHKPMMSITWLSDYVSATIPEGAVVASLGGYVQNAMSVNGHTVDTDVPANAKFTDTNTDTKVTQSNSAANIGYRLLLSNAGTDTDETNVVHKSGSFIANPSTGALYVKGYDRIPLEGNTVDLNTLTLASGHPMSMHYICRTNGGAETISNLPMEAATFLLDVELIRWVGSADYITVQRLVTGSKTEVEYYRTCTSGTWSPWTTRVFTDTVYTLPNAGTGNYGGVKIGSNITVSNGVIGISRNNVNDAVGNAGATEIGLHKTCVGTAEPDDTNCPVGAWYGQY